MIGQAVSTSQNACMIQFSGGGPYDGQSGLYDCDHSNLTIIAHKDGNQFDYNRAGPKHFRLSRIWVGPDSKRVDIWDPKSQ